MARFLSTFSAPKLERWVRDVKTLRPLAHSRRSLLRRLVSEAPGYQAVILRGQVGRRDGYVDLVAAAMIARRGVPVLLADATWEPGSRSVTGGSATVGADVVSPRGGAVIKAIIAALDHPLIHYAVLSTDELTTFPSTWGVDPERVHFTPFCTTSKPSVVRERSGVFAGGNSLRDYRPLLRAAPTIRERITIATTLEMPESTPVNVVAGALSSDAYERASATASIAIVPLLQRTVRSAGQQTYLNAMNAGQAVVVLEAPGVRDYIDHGVTGMIVSGDELAQTVNQLLDDPARAARLGHAAQGVVADRFGAEHYFGRLLSIASELNAG